MDRPRSSGVRGLLLAITFGLATALLLVATALDALQDPDVVRELAEDLATTPEIQQLITEAVTDALITDVTARSPLVAPLLPLIRPILVTIAADVIASEAGTSALTIAIADAITQASVSGPIVVDLRAALIDGASTAPEPIGSLARAAAGDGGAGLVVLRSDGRSAEEVLADRAGSRSTSVASVRPRVLGMTPDIARGLAVVALLVGVVALIAPASSRHSAGASGTASSSATITGRSPRIAWAATGVLVVAASTALALRQVAALVVARLKATSTAAAPDATSTTAELGAPLTSTMETLTPFLVEGITQMLASTRTLASMLILLATLVLISALALLGRGATKRPDTGDVRATTVTTA